MKPSDAAIPRFPRMAKITRIVSHDTSTMRSPKMTSAPQGDAKMASAFMRENYRERPVRSVRDRNAGAQRLLERRDACVERTDLLAQASDFLVRCRGRRRRRSVDRGQGHCPLGPERLGHGEHEQTEEQDLSER